MELNSNNKLTLKAQSKLAQAQSTKRRALKIRKWSKWLISTKKILSVSLKAMILRTKPMELAWKHPLMPIKLNQSIKQTQH